MFISLKSVVDSQEFKDVKILAGKDGLYRNITSISFHNFPASVCRRRKSGSGRRICSDANRP